jgi:hypothetical protein
VTPPEMKFELNLGTLIPLGAMALALAVAWGQLTGAVGEMENRLVKMEAAGAATDVRMRSVETSQSTMTARLDGIKESLDELKATQRETNSILRGLSVQRTP